MAKEIFKRFESLAMFHDYLQRNETQPDFIGFESSKSESSSSWKGTKDYDEAERFFLYGDANTAAKIESGGIAQLRNKLKLDANRRKLYCSVVGFAPHVPNFIAGVPTCMIDAKTVRQKSKVLNLVYNISVNGCVDGDDMQRVAIKMLSAIMMFEANGVRINLYVCDISEKSGQEIGWLLRIKDSGQHLDVLKCVYPLTNPSMLRRHSFRFTEVTKGVRKTFVESYGHAKRDVENLLKSCGLKDAKTLHYYTMQCKTAEEIAKMILN